MSPPQPQASALLAEAAEVKDAPAQDLLAWTERRFGARAAIASSFGVEDMVLIDLARQHAPSLRLFTLDTGRLPPETYELMEVVRKRYGVTVETYFPERARVEALESTNGYFSFRQSLEARKACCAIRKVEPLSRALAGQQAWVTGLRREQSVTRTDVATLEVDSAHGCSSSTRWPRGAAGTSGPTSGRRACPTTRSMTVATRPSAVRPARAR